MPKAVWNGVTIVETDDIAHVAQVHDALERPRVLRVHALDVQVQL